MSRHASLHEDQRKRVVGWRDGTGVTTTDVKEILRVERDARHEYRSVRKSIMRGRTQQVADPLEGLPPTWQVFWSTVPHLDPQAAYRLFLKEQQKAAKEKGKEGKEQVGDSNDGEAEKEEDIEAETVKLEADMRKKKQIFDEKQKLAKEWETKLARVRHLDAQEEQMSRKVVRKMEAASYEHGILEGKIRSSDVYYHFIFDDTQRQNGEKVSLLRRSCAIMDTQIGQLKTEVRDLLKAAAEAQPTSPSANPSASSQRKELPF